MKNKKIIIPLLILLVVSLYVNAVMIFRYTRLIEFVDSGGGVGVEVETEVDGDINLDDEVAANIEDETDFDVEIGYLAPDFTVPLLGDGYFTLSEHLGIPVVVNFWASWCGPCVRKFPSTQTLSEEFGDEVVFIGVNIGEDLNVVQSFIEDGGYTFPIGLDEDASVFLDWNPTGGVPYTVIIGSDGRVANIFPGWADAMHDAFRSAIVETLR